MFHLLTPFFNIFCIFHHLKLSRSDLIQLFLSFSLFGFLLIFFPFLYFFLFEGFNLISNLIHFLFSLFFFLPGHFWCFIHPVFVRFTINTNLPRSSTLIHAYRVLLIFIFDLLWFWKSFNVHQQYKLYYKS